jgi:hypothetical protein
VALAGDEILQAARLRLAKADFIQPALRAGRTQFQSLQSNHGAHSSRASST